MKDLKIPKRKFIITVVKERPKEKPKKQEKIYRRLGVTKSVYHRLVEYNKWRQPLSRAMNDLLEEALESKGF